MTPFPDLQRLADLVAVNQHRWTAALIVDLADHGGARFVSLIHRLGIGRDSLSRTLEATGAAGWVMRNPGYGHPLRPEYVLTPEGIRLAAMAKQQLVAQSQIGIGPQVLTRWSVPIIHSLGTGLQRFNDVARTLPQASPRALSQGLRALTANQLVNRTLFESHPPISLYTLTSTGQILAQAV